MLQSSDSIVNTASDNFLNEMFQQSADTRDDIAKHSIYLKPTRLSNMMQKNKAGHHTSSVLSKGLLIIDDEDEDDDEEDDGMLTEMNRESGITMGR